MHKVFCFHHSNSAFRYYKLQRVPVIVLNNISLLPTTTFNCYAFFFFSLKIWVAVWKQIADIAIISSVWRVTGGVTDSDELLTLKIRWCRLLRQRGAAKTHRIRSPQAVDWAERHQFDSIACSENNSFRTFICHHVLLAGRYNIRVNEKVVEYWADLILCKLTHSFYKIHW